MRFLPLFHRLEGRHCLIVGGGEVALRKARLLVRTGVRLRVIAPEIEPDLAELLAQYQGVFERRPYHDDVRVEDVLVIAATPNKTLNAAVSQRCAELHVTCNVVDSADLSSAIFPSIIDRSPFVVALSSGGSAPVLLRLWRQRLEALIPQRLGALAEFAGSWRKQVNATVTDATVRRRWWESFFSGPLAHRVLNGEENAVAAAVNDQLAALKFETAPQTQGEVFLVGAGPGDPELLTLKALRLMQHADVVLHDALVSHAVLELVRRDAQRIDVGKRRRSARAAQESIEQQMVALARSGKRVLRLKGGDPFVFARGGEEMAALIAAKVPFQVVPGISAANGCAAYAGIPLTHRDLAQSVRFVTGHRQDGEVNLDWPELASPTQTLVFYMGSAALDEICSHLIVNGRSADTPVALIENGTLPNQRVMIGTLTDLPSRVAAMPSKGPTLIIVGEVVRLAAFTTK